MATQEELQAKAFEQNVMMRTNEILTEIADHANSEKDNGVSDMVQRVRSMEITLAVRMAKLELFLEMGMEAQQIWIPDA